MWCIMVLSLLLSGDDRVSICQPTQYASRGECERDRDVAQAHPLAGDERKRFVSCVPNGPRLDANAGRPLD